jgi:Ca-activated chloride channel homolog
VNAHRTYLIFGAAAVLFAGAMAVHFAESRLKTGPGWQVPQDGPVSKPAPLAVGPAQGFVDGTLRLSYAYTHGAALGTREARAQLVVDVDAMVSNGVAAPLDVAIVVDTSGSMVGDKIEKARAATREVLSQLRPGDRATLVAYSTDARVLFPLTEVRTGSNEMGTFADSLIAAGGTNIEDGLDAGLTELTRRPAANRLQRIILISDGHATVGTTDPSALAGLAARAYDRKVSVTTMGLGADYNELSLTDMARRGGGNYYFIGRTAELQAVLQAELKTLQRLVARDATLHVKLAPGVRLAQMFGFTHTRTRDNSLQIPMSAFHSGQNKSLVLALDLGNLEGKSTISPASFRLEYADLVTDKVVSAPLAGASLAVVPARQSSMGPVPVDPAAMLSVRNREAVVRVERVKAAAAYERAMQRYEEGRQAEAQEILRGASRDLRAASKGLGGAPTLAKQAEAADSVADEAVRIDRKTTAGKKWLKGNRYDSYKLMLSK